MAWVPLQQALPYQLDKRSTEKSHEGDKPGGCTNNAIAFVLTLDSIEFEIDKLRDITNKRQDLANPVIDQRKSREEVHDSTSDRLYALDKENERKPMQDD